MIDYRVKTFLALCDFMNYRKTAQILNMTQPAVTQHIHFLEISTAASCLTMTDTA